MRLLLDEMFGPDVASAVRHRGHHVDRVSDVLPHSSQDLQVFEKVQSGRYEALITMDRFGPGKPEDRNAALGAMSAGVRIAELRLPAGRDSTSERIAALLLHLEDIEHIVEPNSLVRRIRFGREVGLQRSETLYDVLNEIGRTRGD